MKITEQLIARLRIAGFRGALLQGDMRLQRRHVFAAGALDKAGQHSSLDHAPRRKHFVRLCYRRLRDEGAAPGYQCDELVRRELEQGLADLGARDAEDFAQRFFPQLGAGRQFVRGDGFGDALVDRSAAQRRLALCSLAGRAHAATFENGCVARQCCAMSMRRQIHTLSCDCT